MYMQSHLGGARHEVKRESDDSESLGHHVQSENAFKECVDTTSHEEDSNVAGAYDDDNQSSEEAQNQLVVYDPLANERDATQTIPEPLVFPPVPRYSSPSTPPKVLPSIGAFTVQCANCFKWRLIPTKEKYEEIREHILEQPFVCEAAREWRPEISCDDPADILQDGSRLWAIDKPNIAQPPPGWERIMLHQLAKDFVQWLRFKKYIQQGVTLSQFSFQIPKPLQENYVRKRTARNSASDDGSKPVISRPLAEVSPISWAGPSDMNTVEPSQSSPYFESPVLENVDRPAKKQATKACNSN
ncbi:Zinc finger, CW-type [Dillenia turbinata]|uniref:Zinc finger, CW-type n=1 Tax=Dillenia turbinata TaxID=194707 RepID=A0AAN8ZNV5_9MAGN